MTVRSSGRRGDQVALTSVMHEFQESVSLVVDYRLEESKPGTRSILSVYPLSKHRVPALVLHFDEQDMGWSEGWTRGKVTIPRGTYYVMFLVTLGLPYHSDVYLDKITFGRTDKHRRIPTPTGNYLLVYFVSNGMY